MRRIAGRSGTVGELLSGVSSGVDLSIVDGEEAKDGAAVEAGGGKAGG